MNPLDRNDTKIDSSKFDEKRRPVTPKDKEVTHGVYEHKKTKEELEEDWARAKALDKKGRGPINKDKEGKTKSPSLFDLAQDVSESEDVSENEFLTAKEKLHSESDHPSEKSNKFSLDMGLKPAPKAQESSSLFSLASNTARSETYESDVEKTLKSPFDAVDTKKPQPELDASKLSPLTYLSQQQTNQENFSALTSAPIAAPNTNPERLQKMIDEIVKHLYQVEKSGETSTTIVLNNEKGLFKGVSIQIKEFDAAKGQLNITIDNLNPDAKAMIDRHQNILMDELLKKGFQVQQFIATSTIENPRFENLKGSEKNPDRESPDQRERENKEKNEKQKR